MKVYIKLLALVVVAALLIGSAYAIFFMGENNNNKSTDTIPPVFESITGNTTGTAGKITTISVVFSDDVGVTVATLYYKQAEASVWSSISILNGSVDIAIPADALSDYYYYVTINDAAGNGPVGDPSIDGSSYYSITISPSDESFTHTVFIEEGTATWCTNCPAVANILELLYTSHSYNFYYVSLVDDKNTLAHNRLYTDYNVLGFPTVFVDGGYKVVTGANDAQSLITQALQTAQQRSVPKIKTLITADYSNETKVMTVNVQVINRESQPYSGHVKVYMTDIVSPWNGYDGKPYHYSLVDYAVDQDITVDANDSKVITQTKDISDYDVDNLMLIAVVSSSVPNQGYAASDNQNPFTAYYADATNATTLIQGGNLPPVVEISSPQKGKIYWNGNPTKGKFQKFLFLKLIPSYFIYNKTWLFGWKKVISVNASDESGIAKVEFYIDGTLRYNTTQAPYEWTFNKFTIFPLHPKKHTLTVIAYDMVGKSSEVSIDFLVRSI